MKGRFTECSFAGERLFLVVCDRYVYPLLISTYGHPLPPDTRTYIEHPLFSRFLRKSSGRISKTLKNMLVTSLTLKISVKSFCHIFRPVKTPKSICSCQDDNLLTFQTRLFSPAKMFLPIREGPFMLPDNFLTLSFGYLD